MIMGHKWKILEKKEISVAGYEGVIHSVVLRLLAKKGLKKKEDIDSFLFPKYDQDVLDPFLFYQMEKTVERIKIARDKGEKVIIYGDYDADGVTSSVILKEALKELRIKSEVYIPDKRKEGYGVNMEAIEEFSKKKISLIITVDCGIANAEEIDRANELGIDVIVTDHHHVPEKLPNAFANINPKIKDCGYPNSDLAGVGVAFKLVQALYRKLIPEKEEQVKWFLDLVAIGTVADLVPLTSENRAIVKYGLIVLSKTRRVGLQELFKVGRIQIDENNFPDTQKIAFQLAPRINAAGRMDHAKLAYDLLKEKDRVKARNMALELESKNQERQRKTKFLADEVKEVANKSFKERKFIFSVGENFPIGIIGLVAGKISDEFNKPTAVFHREGEKITGSFRSISRLNIIEAISQCGDMLLKFGGHAQAAGVTVESGNLEKFQIKLGSIIEKELEGKDISPEFNIDEELKADEVGFDLTEDLKKLEPFGQGNQEPVFLMRKMIVQDLRWVGKDENHLKLFLRPSENSPKIFEAIGFNLRDRFAQIKTEDNLDIIFRLYQDEWNGSKKIQFQIVDIKIR